MNKLPFPSAYWVIKNRLMAGGIPASLVETETNQKLEGLIDAGINVVVNLLEEDERNYQGQLFFNYAPVLAENNIVTKRFPIKDLTVPSIIQMTNILNFIDEAHSKNKIVYVHCWGGVGRTGTVVGCYLKKHGLADNKNVFNLIQSLKSGSSIKDRLSPENNLQRDFVLNWKNGR